MLPYRRTISQPLGFSLSGLYFRLCLHNHTAFVFTQTKAYIFKRGFTSAPSSASSPHSKWALLGAGVALGGTSAFLFMSEEKFGSIQTTFVPSKEDYQNVYNEIARLLIEMDEYDDGSYGPVLLRLSWHTSGTYDKTTRTGGKMFPWITYSDLWTLAGVTAVQELGGPTIPWRPGRQDADSTACPPDGRLPIASKGPTHLRAIFYRMGFDDREIVALSGAHALGRAHTDRTGYEGPWDFSPTVFTNEFFRLLVEEEWLKREWDGPLQYTDKTTKTLMMLPTDMALIEDAEFKPHVERYARDSDVFFREFADAFVKLLELGVPFTGQGSDRWVFVRSE
ncbi:heme peroxidase [Aspergillus novofumigatus IBT 16806]|uniref:Peroxidase n=1 Tax=Aspergillus novofumigatus (strain IBT 16806) TaxID=1392255 RepID=A0A2I1CGY7_ASPN1|nr:heme peroxidase [Aspergillus novofumigatus IBT 16806]PKX96896.1 heme peroxidase [Aspergillus novofumigatus IBT 16806]